MIVLGGNLLSELNKLKSTVFYFYPKIKVQGV